MRMWLWLVAAVVQFHLVASFVDVKALLDAYIPGHGLSDYALTTIFRWILVSLAVFAVWSWPYRAELKQAWSAAEHSESNLVAIALNIAALVLFTGIVWITSGDSGTIESVAWPLQILLGMLCFGMVGALLSTVVPLGKFGALLWRWRARLILSAGIGAGVMGVAISKKLLWSGDLLAGVTLHLSAAIMQLYEPVVNVNVAERTISVGNFTALIGGPCSGMEGIALVAVFVSGYLWVFRSELPFPKVLLLYPIGFTASFLLNSVRIAALTSIGAHVSPEMAVDGFHSRAGWIAFLIVTLSLMAVALGLTSRRATAAGATAAPSVRYTESATYLVPFVALMIGTLVVSAAVPLHYPVYVFKVAIAAAALWSIRKAYAIWKPQISTEAIAGGLFVGVVWIATQAETAAGTALGAWLAEIGPVLAVAWLLVRGIGTIVLVPIAEELAFRGYIYRRLIARDFYQVDPGRLSWFALAVSSGLFGLLHNRWELGVVAGVVFALVMLRRGRLGDAIMAHALANALIFAWALAFQQWSLL